MIKSTTYSLFTRFRCFALFIVLACVSCSKPPEPTPNPIPPTPSPSRPTGVIDYFYANDDLVGYNRFTILHWLVSGTNSLTTVTLSGQLANFRDDVNSGLMTKDTVFTLLVNSGAEQKVTLHVADPVTTSLWNDNKSLKKTRSEVTTDSSWKDTAISKEIADQRIFFTLKKSSVIVKISDATSRYGGMFTVTQLIPPTPPNNVVTPATFTWNGVTYTIVSVDTISLVVMYQAPDKLGVLRSWRDTYSFM